jgi:hypothetical protein
LVKKTDDAIEATIDKYFANPYNISSVLTENTGKYSSDSYIWNKDEAEKDKTKLLKKIDPLTGLAVLDDEAPHYKEQVNQAREWVKKTMLGKLDSKRKVDTTAQTQLQERRAPTEGEIGRQDKKKLARNVAQNLIYSLTGDANRSDAGTKYLSSVTGLPFRKTKNGYVITNADGREQEFKFKADNKTLANPTEFTKSFIGTVSSALDINEDDVLREFGSLLPKGAQINLNTEASGFSKEAPITNPVDRYNQAVSTSVGNSQAFLKANKVGFVEELNKSLLALGFEAKASMPSISSSINNNVYIVDTKTGKQSPTFKITKDQATNKTVLKKMSDYLKASLEGTTPEEKESAAEARIQSLRSGVAGELDE